MPLFMELFPQRSQRPAAGQGVCILPSIPECPVFKVQTQAPVRIRKGPFLCSHPLRKVFSPRRVSGSKAAMDSFIYENWRVHPRDLAPRRAFEDERASSGAGRGQREPPSGRPSKRGGGAAMKRSVSRAGPGDQHRGNRARHHNGGGPAVVRGRRSKGPRKEKGHTLTEPGNKIQSLNILDFYKRCKIDCWKKMNDLFKA